MRCDAVRCGAVRCDAVRCAATQKEASQLLLLRLLLKFGVLVVDLHTFEVTLHDPYKIEQLFFAGIGSGPGPPRFRSFFPLRNRTHLEKL